MELEKQVVSLELAKKLKELGIEQDSLFYWRSPAKAHGRMDWNISGCVDTHANENYSAFTCAELGEMLPKEINNHELTFLKHKKWHCGYCDLSSEYQTLQHWDCREESETETDCRAKMLIYLIENNLLTNPRGEIRV